MIFLFVVNIFYRFLGNKQTEEKERNMCDGQIGKTTIEVSGTFQLLCVVYSDFNSLIFHKYCVQLKNHYNKSILSSQRRNMIFMLQYTFHINHRIYVCIHTYNNTVQSVTIILL